jgi:hypothetical protein
MHDLLRAYATDLARQLNGTSRRMVAPITPNSSTVGSPLT